MNRNITKATKKEKSELLKQVQKYSSLQTGYSFLGYSKKKRKFIIRNRKQ